MLVMSDADDVGVEAEGDEFHGDDDSCGEAAQALGPVVKLIVAGAGAGAGAGVAAAATDAGDRSSSILLHKLCLCTHSPRSSGRLFPLPTASALSRIPGGRSVAFRPRMRAEEWVRVSRR